MRFLPLLLAPLLAFPAFLIAAPAAVEPSDWQGIVAAHEQSRHAIQCLPDQRHAARNSGQGWITEFDGRGFTVVPDQGGWTWGLEPANAGDRAPGQRVEGNKLSYVWSDCLTEWFINDGNGLEQGWTLSARPAAMSGPLEIALNIRGGLQAEVSGDALSLVFRDAQGHSVLNYGGLKAWDADGKVLAARFVLREEGGVRLRVEDAGARYPVTIDPTAQAAYLKASNPGVQDYFGSAVAISGDTVVIGAPYEDSNATGVNGNQADNTGSDSGAVYVFVRNGGSWSQQAYLKAHNSGGNDRFGGSVAISGDTIVVGSEWESSNAAGINGDGSNNYLTLSGAAYVFQRSGGTWSQQAYLKASNPQASARFGNSVAISSETVLVGAYQESSAATGVNGNQLNTSASGAGAAYVFVRNGATWTQQAYLKASNTGANDSFGMSVALSGDTAAIGAYQESSNATGVNGNQQDNSIGSSGAVYVFTRSSSAWSQQAYLKASNSGDGDTFGWGLALSGDLLVVGAPQEDSNASGVNGNQADNSVQESGAAYLFTRSAGVWSQQAYLKSSNPGVGDFFGFRMAASDDTLLIGAFGEGSNATGIGGNQADDSIPYAGAAYLFKREGNAWVQRNYLKPAAAAPVGFGYVVAMDGLTAVIGAYSDASAATGVNGNPAGSATQGSGAAYVFDLQQEFFLTVMPAAHGSVSGGGAYAAQGSATLTATAAPGYVFGQWSGDASGSGNPLTVLMNGPKTISALFIPDSSDADGDGLSAFLELTVYGTDPAKADTDGDGLSDGWEVGRGRYSIISGSFTWAQARADALSRGGDLACFPTADRWNRAVETLPPNAFDSFTGLWIGASDAGTEGVWTWVNGEAFSYSRWGTGRPTTTAGNILDYGEISGGNGAEIGNWYDRSSTAVRDGYLLETGYATNPTVADADGDGLNDSAEQAAGSSPFLVDTDGDGLTDPQEVNLTHTNPRLADSDNDGTSDAAEDLDGDGLGNLAEVAQHGSNPLLADTDGDGLSDGVEASYPGSYYQLVAGSFTYAAASADAAARHGRVAAFPDSAEYARVTTEVRRASQEHLWIGLSDAGSEGVWVWTDATAASYTRWLSGQPDGGIGENHVVIAQGSAQWADAAAAFVAGGYIFERRGLDPLVADTDGDGLPDSTEISSTQSNPQRADTDGDGLSDGAEVNTHHTNPLKTDTDEDGLGDLAEIEIHHSNPNLKDSDGDGFDDLFEVSTGFSPILATSTPDAQSTLLTAVEFRFNAANGASYRIEASSDLLEWTVIENGIVGGGAVVTRFYSTENRPQRYFRARRN